MITQIYLQKSHNHYYVKYMCGKDASLYYALILTLGIYLYVSILISLFISADIVLCTISIT